MADDPIFWLAMAGVGGLGLGAGLVIGALLARVLRKWLTDEADKGNEEK